MGHTPFADWPCSVARTMNLLGDRWTPLVLREVFYGTRRFDDFQQRLGIARNTLADRLARLVDDGLLQKQPYQNDPVRYDYLPTEMGQDFYPVLVAMARWGDKWLAGDDGPPIEYHHVPCQHDTHAEVVCAHCREPLALSDVSIRMGPGYPAHLANRPEVRRRFSH
jgi:DNA-binding HxlR family transcriptional regulator